MVQRAGRQEEPSCGAAAAEDCSAADGFLGLPRPLSCCFCGTFEARVRARERRRLGTRARTRPAALLAGWRSLAPCCCRGFAHHLKVSAVSRRADRAAKSLREAAAAAAEPGGVSASKPVPKGCAEESRAGVESGRRKGVAAAPLWSSSSPGIIVGKGEEWQVEASWEATYFPSSPPQRCPLVAHGRIALLAYPISLPSAKGSGEAGHRSGLWPPPGLVGKGAGEDSGGLQEILWKSIVR